MNFPFADWPSANNTPPVGLGRRSIHPKQRLFANIEIKLTGIQDNVRSQQSGDVKARTSLYITSANLYKTVILDTGRDADLKKENSETTPMNKRLVRENSERITWVCR